MSALLRITLVGIHLAMACGFQVDSLFPAQTSDASDAGGGTTASSDGNDDTSDGSGDSEERCDVVTDDDERIIPSVPRPSYLGSYIDPVFGTTVIRITGDVGSAIPNIGGQWGSVARHYFSKDPAWNSSQSLLVIKKNLDDGGTPSWPVWLFLDGETYEPLFAKSNPAGATEALWHPTSPDLMVFQGDHDVGTWNVQTDALDVRGTFAEYTISHRDEWNPSNDGRWIAVSATKDGNDVTFAYDLQQQVKYPDIDLSWTSIDNVSISPTGTYIVLKTNDDYTQVYDKDGNEIGGLWDTYGDPSVFDVTIDRNGDEVAVGVSKTLHDGRLIKRRLSDGQITVLVDFGWAVHTSTRSIQKPGWAYVSYQVRESHRAPLLDELVAVNIDGFNDIQRLAHMHTQRGDYDSEAHAVPSPDGLRVLFASNWEDSTLRPVHTYVVDLRALCTMHDVISSSTANLRVVDGP